ncbi:MAG: YicC/YloC family endoribonuclease [Acidobacteriota bacterium]
MRSMTGYGAAEGGSPRWSVKASVRGVNHRFLDVALRLPEARRALEAELRERIARDAERGRVEHQVDVTLLLREAPKVELDRVLAEEILSAFRDLERHGQVTAGPTAGDLLRLPGVLQVSAPAESWQEDDGALLLQVVDRAMAQFAEAREREGSRLREIVLDRLATLEKIRSELEDCRAQAVTEILDNLRRRLHELVAGQSLDEARLAQEAALLADRSDVREELDRLAAHFAHFREVAAESGAIGKRLDFLVQEIFRELNTLGSKFRDPRMLRRLLDAKSTCEQLREQVQNVE